MKAKITKLHKERLFVVLFYAHYLATNENSGYFIKTLKQSRLTV